MQIGTEDYFNRKKEWAKTVYTAQKEIYCPYFKTKVVLNSDGFHHLQFSTRTERNKNEQLFKFSLLPLGLELVRKSSTIQEYRELFTPIGKRSTRDGFIPMKKVEYWGLVAIIRDNKIKVRTVLRKIGDGNVMFWSVMLYSKRRNGHQKLWDGDMENE